MKKTMNMKKTLAAVLATAVAATAGVAQNQELLESKVDSANAKRGLELGGSIRAVAQRSTFQTDNDPNAVNQMPNIERGEFVTGDLNFGFRPYENVRANAVLRLEAGMQEYFAAAAKSISVPWINVEGNIGNSFYWVVGDFRQEYSPLTIYNPGVDVMYEAQIFARKRYMAQKEQFLEGNQRNLQGVNVQYRQDLNEALGQVRAEGIFARLNRNTVLDLSGAEGNVLPMDTVWGASQASNTDKWLLAGNFELLPLNKKLYVGVTPMWIFDNEDTYSYTYRRKLNDKNNSYELDDINPYELNPQNTMVVSARVGADIGSFTGNSNLVADLTAEVAISSDDVYHVDTTIVDDENVYSFTQETLNGMAVLVNANVGYQTSSFGVKLAVDGVYNDSNWFNNLAQSPSFFAQRILNSDKDGNSVKYAVSSPLYSTFDALYNFNPKFAPVTTGMGTNDDAFKAGQTNSYNIANYNKNSWTSNVFSRNQLALLSTLTDPTLQLSLPNGLATSNRLGARATLTANVGDAIEAQAMFSTFQQVAPEAVMISNDYEGNKVFAQYKAASFMEYGVGAKIDIFKLLGFSKPLEISGSYKHAERSLETDNWASLGLVDETTSLKSDFINAGLYVQYLPRLGVNAGFQMINTEFVDKNQLAAYNKNVNKKEIGVNPMVKGSQMQWMVGVDYNIAKNAWLAVNFGIVTVSNEYNTEMARDAYTQGYSDSYEKSKKKFADPENPTDEEKAKALTTAEKAAKTAAQAYLSANLPDYYDVTTDAAGSFKHEFSQVVLEASINVEF